MKIITTVGTSIFENFAKSPEGKKMPTFVSSLKELKKESHSYNEWGKPGVKNKLEKISKDLGNWCEDNPSASAEIKSILTIQEQLGSEVEVYLIATDTVLSVKAAQLIKESFENRNITTISFELPDTSGNQTGSNFIIENLQVTNQLNYEKGLHNLIDVLDKITESNDILNITGGYKAIIPILTLYGQLKSLPVKYIFNDIDLEHNPEVISISNLPINFDTTVVHLYYPYYTNKKSFNLSNINDQQKKILKKLSDNYGLFRLNGNIYERTVLGRLINSFAFFNAPESVQVLGLFIEYKLFEFYNEQLENTKVFRDHSITGGDIKYDLVFESDGKRTLVEIKSADQIFHALEPKKKGRNTFEQIQNQFEKDLIPSEEIPEEYHVYFYFIGKEYPDMTKVKEALNKIEEYVKSVSLNKTKFKSLYFCLNLKLEKHSSNNPYKSIFSKDFVFKKLDFKLI